MSGHQQLSALRHTLQPLPRVQRGCELMRRHCPTAMLHARRGAERSGVVLAAVPFMADQLQSRAFCFILLIICIDIL